MGVAAMLVMWPGRFEQLFVPPSSGGHIWNLVTIGPAVSEEKSFEIVDGRTTDDDDDDGRRRTTEPYHPISSPGAAGSGELKSTFLCINFKSKRHLKKKSKTNQLLFTFCSYNIIWVLYQFSMWYYVFYVFNVILCFLWQKHFWNITTLSGHWKVAMTCHDVDPIQLWMDQSIKTRDLVM